MSNPDILPQQRRENPDPEERTTPVPWLVLALAAALAAFSVDHISHADLGAPSAWGDGRSLAELPATSPWRARNSTAEGNLRGKVPACHQATGQACRAYFRRWPAPSGWPANPARSRQYCCMASTARSRSMDSPTGRDAGLRRFARRCRDRRGADPYPQPVGQCRRADRH